jgi:hypothetical protein
MDVIGLAREMQTWKSKWTTKPCQFILTCFNSSITKCKRRKGKLAMFKGFVTVGYTTTIYHCLKGPLWKAIRRLRLIIYYHNLHLWFRMIYISLGDIGGLLEVFSRWHKWNIWFLTKKIVTHKGREHNNIWSITKNYLFTHIRNSNILHIFRKIY